MDVSIHSAFAAYLESIADWRRSRYDDDLRDKRNLRSASALRDLANFVRGLDDDDPRLRRLAELGLRGGVFEAGQQTAYEIGRFHFFSTEATFDGFLDWVVELAERDSAEMGRFGGPQVVGDEPW